MRRSLVAYTFFIFSAVLGAAANLQPGPGVDLSSFCSNGHEHCPEAVAATKTTSSKVVPFGKKARLSNALRYAQSMANKASDHQRRQSAPSSLPQLERTGVVQVFNGASSVGYISATTVDNAIYRVDSNLINAAIVTVVAPSSETESSDLRVSITGSDISSRFPLLGLVQGRDNVDANIGSGSYHYLYLAGVALPGTGPGDTPTVVDNSYSDATLMFKAAQTDLWDINFITGVMVPKWINIDGTSQNTILFTQDDIVYAGGDVDAFSNEYSGSSVTSITFKFVF